MSVTETCFFGGEQLNLPSLRQLSFHFFFCCKYTTNFPVLVTVFSVCRENVSQRPYFCRNFFRLQRANQIMSYIWEFFFHSKSCLKRHYLTKWCLSDYFFSKKRIPKCNSEINQHAAGEKNFGKNTVAETTFCDKQRKRSLRQENWLFIYKKKMER